MIADISFLERSIEEKQKKAREKFRAQRRTPLYTFVALSVIVTGTFGGYLSLHAATSVRRAPLVFQGRITDANYVPIADPSTRRMVFRIHTHATNSACVWSTGNAADTAEATNCAIAITTAGDNAAEDTASVAATITRGVFSVPLGDTAYHANMRSLRLDFNNTADEVYYLEISVKNASGEYETLSPRIRVGSSAYAYNADELDGITSASFLRVDSTTTQTAATSGTPTAISFSGATHTGLTAATEASDVVFDLDRGGSAVQFATGALTTQRAFHITSPTYSFVGASILTNAATLAVVGMPTAGTNATITNPVGLWLQGLTTTTVGQFFKISHPSATTTTGDYIGSHIDLTNLASGTTDGLATYGTAISTPSLANAAASQVSIYGLNIDGRQGGTARLSNTNAGGQALWWGTNITMPQQTQNAGTTTAYGIQISGVAAQTSGTRYALTTDSFAGSVGFGTTSPTSFLTVTPPAVSGGRGAFTLTPGAHTAVTTEVIDFNSAGHALTTPLTLTGGIVAQRFNVFAPSTITASSAQVVTDAATVAITGAPNAVDAGSAAITTSSALHIYRDNGTTTLTDNITNAYSLYVEKPSGGVSGADYTAYFETGGTTGVGIGTATPATALDISGDLALRVSAFTASNGSNDNISIGAVSYVRVAGPTGVFNVTGIAGGVNGKVVVLYNSTSQNMTITNEATSTAANRILTGTGADIATTGTGSVTLIYSSTDSRWIVIAVNQ